MGVALGLFALGTLISGFAPSIGALILVRVCTGAAAAGVIPVAIAYLSDAVPYAERQAALGRVVSVAAFGGVISAALGGVIAALVSWRALFIGYGALAVLVAAVLLRLPVRRVRPPGHRPAGILAPYRAIAVQGGRRAAALYGLVCFEGFAATSTLGYLGALLFERDQLSYGVIGALLTLNGVGTHARPPAWLGASSRGWAGRDGANRRHTDGGRLRARRAPADFGLLPAGDAAERRGLRYRPQHAADPRDGAGASAARDSDRALRVCALAGRWAGHLRGWAGDRARRIHNDPARDGGGAGDLYRHRGAVAPNQTSRGASIRTAGGRDGHTSSKKPRFPDRSRPALDHSIVFFRRLGAGILPST